MLLTPLIKHFDRLMIFKIAEVDTLTLLATSAKII
jgi:hypothetical protein